jgi:predicted nucleotidyltransferase
MDEQILFGPLASRVKEGAKWDDAYPSTQAWADEFEQLLSVARDQDVFDGYLPRLQGRDRQRNAALAELRVAKFLADLGFAPQADTWKPNGGPDSDGEFAVRSPAGSEVIVEVKYPTWQSELRKEEIEAGRTNQPKHKDLEARAVGPWMAIQHGIRKASAKLDGEVPSLLVLCDELFVSLCTSPDLFAWQALYQEPRLVATNPDHFESGYFTDSRYENLGGVGIFKVESNRYTPVPYGLRVYVNGFALPSARLPRDFVRGFGAIRLWNDPAEPDPKLKEKRLGDTDRIDRSTISRVLAAQRQALARFGVRDLRLFGSVARGENDPASDLDFVVETAPKTFANYMGSKEYLEGLFGCRVDLVLEDSIKPGLRQSILRECVHAARL